MKMIPPAEFTSLAAAAIANEATDAQLEALESAIMESAGGADLFRDIAEQQACTETAAQTAAQAAAQVRATSMPLPARVALLGFGAMAAACVVLLGAGLLYLHAARPLQQATAQHDVSVTANAEAGADPAIPLIPAIPGDSAVPVAADTVPEPSTSLLLLSGLAAILLRRRRHLP